MADTKRDLMRTDVGKADKLAGTATPLFFSTRTGADEACLELDWLGVGFFDKVIVAWRLQGVPVKREDLQ